MQTDASEEMELNAPEDEGDLWDDGEHVLGWIPSELPTGCVVHVAKTKA